MALRLEEPRKRTGQTGTAGALPTASGGVNSFQQMLNAYNAGNAAGAQAPAGAMNSFQQMLNAYDAGNAGGGATGSGSAGGGSGLLAQASGMIDPNRLTELNAAAERLGGQELAAGLANGDTNAYRQLLSSYDAGNSAAPAASPAGGSKGTNTTTSSWTGKKNYAVNWLPDEGFGAMSDADRAAWENINAKYAAGDRSWIRDTNAFRTAGNWSSYIDDNGKLNGWVRVGTGYMGLGGDYLPVMNGQLDVKGLHLPGNYADRNQYVFYDPEGNTYMLDARGNLINAGTWEYQDPRKSYPIDGYLHGSFRSSDGNTYDFDTASEEILNRHGYTRDADGHVRMQFYENAPDFNGYGSPSGKVGRYGEDAYGGNPRGNGGGAGAGNGGAGYGGANAGYGGTGYGNGALDAITRPGQNVNSPTDWQSYIDAYDYGRAPEWEGTEYERKRDEALQTAQDMEWDFDPETDPVWQAYQKQYRREGQRAAEDALARAAAMTGGIPSSYAATAGSQAANYYAAQLSDRLPGIYQDAYNRYYNEFQKQLAIADEYQGYGQTEYNRYLDRLGQWNTDRNFQYGLNRDAVDDARYADETAYNRAWNEDERAYNRRYRAERDAISDERYDREWAQSLREYADSQGWKQKEWEQYLREYGDQLSEQERQWAYQQARDALSDERYEREWEYNAGRDALSDERYERQYSDAEYADAMAFLHSYGMVAGKYAEILRVPAGTTEEQYYALYGATPPGSSSGGGYRYSGGGGKSGSGKEKTEEAESAGYDKSGKRSGTWTDNDGFTYNGYHQNGQYKTVNYDSVWRTIYAKAANGASKTAVTQTLIDLVEDRQITEYEANMILEDIGYKTRSGGTGRNTIGPNNVQMVE